MKKSIVFLSKFTILSILTVTFSSLTFESQAMKISDLKPGMVITGDDLKNVKIKGPSVKMFKKADREIHLNMYNEVKSAYSIVLDFTNVQHADQVINKQFAAGYQVFFSKENEIVADSMIEAEFFAENISCLSANLVNEADKSVNDQFYTEL
jgi:hypothetical protein